jgi:hypothetical protein
MKRLWLIAMLLGLCSATSFCDGPSMDSLGKPTTDCFFISLTQQQVVQVGRGRILTLNKQQRRALKKSPRFPSTIHVVTRSYNDCTCGMVYCIWFSPNIVAIPKHEVDTSGEPNEIYEGYEAKPSQSICIDANGSIFYRLKQLTMNDVYRKIVEAVKNEDWLDRSIWVSLPPVLSEEKERALQKKIDTIKNKCKTLDVKYRPS